MNIKFVDFVVFPCATKQMAVKWQHPKNWYDIVATIFSENLDQIFLYKTHPYLFLFLFFTEVTSNISLTLKLIFLSSEQQNDTKCNRGNTV